MDRAELVLKLRDNRYLCHQTLFSARHSDTTPSFHRQLIQEWHDDELHRVMLCFRGSAKTTISEEAFIIRALFQEFKNGLVLGENLPRATEKLEAIKHELETNEVIIDLFGFQEGPTWQATKIVLANGVCIQAIGAGQGMRGTKYLSERPDCLLCDDIEGDKDASTPEQRKATRGWFFGTVLPACAPRGRRRLRVAGTPLDAESLLMELQKLTEWRTTQVPVKSIDSASGDWVSSWPQRFPLEEIDKIEQEYALSGNILDFNREYMCQAIAESDRAFKPEYFRSEPIARTYQPVYIMYDPARTVNRQSAHTGKVVWSWSGNRLIVWESGGYFWLPDEIISDVFVSNDTYAPVTIGVEEDGLHEFIMQPLRQRMAQTRTVLPLQAMKAPRGKLDFIKSLQPFFKAREVVFVGDNHDELRKQLLSFPTGRIDVPNALAYALTLRPGRPVYEEFDDRCIEEGLKPRRLSPYYCVLHSDGIHTSAQLIQLDQGTLFILGDFVHEGAPSQSLPGLLREVQTYAGRELTFITPPIHYRSFDTIGLSSALRRLQTSCQRGGDPLGGQMALHEGLRSERGIRLSPQATWTLRALSSGHCVNAKPGVYSLLVEGLESFLARAALIVPDEDVNYAYTATGQRYISSRPQSGGDPYRGVKIVE